VVGIWLSSTHLASSVVDNNSRHQYNYHKTNVHYVFGFPVSLSIQKGGRVEVCKGQGAVDSPVLIKNNIKFSSYIGKFRVEQLPVIHEEGLPNM
jgi:hypothetical protein